MLYNIIPLILILISGGVIIYIISKKFPAVVSLDVESIPQEKEKRVKQQIIHNRLKRNLNRGWVSIQRFLKPVTNWISNYIKQTYDKLINLKEHYARTSDIKQGSVDEIDDLFSSAEEFKRKEAYEEAEKCYIKIISLDSKNIEAFKKLGLLYLEIDKIEEAKSTLEHVLKLTEEDAEVYGNLADITKDKGNLKKSKEYYLRSIQLNNENGKNYLNLAEIYQSSGDNKEAMKAIKQALKIEPKNPKYLDAMFNLSILIKDKADALDAYKIMKAINPENQRLPEMKKEMDAL
ncbi:MAG: tetratricopeptide repeat protein [Candidatus Falkowbacteria bacterium]